MSAVLASSGIVKYSPEYGPFLMKLAREMHAESVLSAIRLDEDKLRSQLALAISNPHVYLRLWLHEGEVVGGLWGFLAEPYWTTDRIAYDRAWFMTRRGSLSAVRLLRDFERWAREMGARWIMPGQTTGVRVDETRELFCKLGYSVIGFNVMKAI
jgi:hypothetical protein